jgi:tetratricopeptide (TPR) repeat protein
MLLIQPDPAALIPLYEKALAEREKAFGPNHPKVARSATDLGLYLRNLGDGNAAASQFRRALAIDLQTLKETTRTVAEDLENLASVSPPRDALVLYHRASKCTDLGISARNLANYAALQQAGGDRAGAATSYKQALAKEEAASGPEHPRVAVRLNDLALLLEPNAAEPLVRRALAIQQKKLGPRHPETGSSLSNLANLLLATNRLTEAERTQRQALQVLEDALGPWHGRVGISCSNLADVLAAKGEFAAAKTLYERTLAIDEKIYGPVHPEVAADLENLAAVVGQMGDEEEARKLLARAKRITGAK